MGLERSGGMGPGEGREGRGKERRGGKGRGGKKGFPKSPLPSKNPRSATEVAFKYGCSGFYGLWNKNTAWFRGQLLPITTDTNLIYKVP